MNIDYESPIPKYYQLKRIILQQIKDGTLKVNTKLPSEPALARQFLISRPTVRQALNELVNEGLLYRKRGIGTFVSGAEPKQQPKMPEKIAVLIPDVTYFFPPVVKAIEDCAKEKGYSVILCNTEDDQNREEKYLKKHLKSDTAGVICYPIKYEARNEALIALMRRIPVVVLCRTPKDTLVDKVAVDNAAGAYDATVHLIDQGHRKIAFVNIGIANPTAEAERINGYIKALTEHKLPLVDELIKTGAHFSKKPENLDDEIVKFFNESGLTAIVAMNDLVAARIFRALNSIGVKIPDDVAIVGYDNTIIASSFPVPLSSVDIPRAEMGKKAAELLFRRIEKRGDELSVQEVILSPRLIVRQSSLSHAAERLVSSSTTEDESLAVINAFGVGTV